MNALQAAGIDTIHHIVPLHYLPLVLRDRALKSKQQLMKEGYEGTHFRQTSSAADLKRGFGNRIHCTVMEWPPILRAKLERGFPHLVFTIPAASLPDEFDLCRFNIAKGRYLRSGHSPLPESPRNGRYIGTYELPVARTRADQEALLEAAGHPATMIEVLVEGQFALPPDTEIRVFDRWDEALARRIEAALESGFSISRQSPRCDYGESCFYRGKVEGFVARALENPAWKGDGLDFDRLR